MRWHIRECKTIHRFLFWGLGRGDQLQPSLPEASLQSPPEARGPGHSLLSRFPGCPFSKHAGGVRPCLFGGEAGFPSPALFSCDRDPCMHSSQPSHAGPRGKGVQCHLRCSLGCEWRGLCLGPGILCCLPAHVKLWEVILLDGELHRFKSRT